jgi:tetratricopeptide (TPR) repeat protein
VVTRLDPEALRAELGSVRVEFQLGHPASAVHRYRSIRERIESSGDDRAEVVAQRAQVMLGLAAAEFEVTGDLGAALSLLDEAEAVATEVARQTGSAALIASTRGQRGLLLQRNGRRREALLALDGAAEVRGSATPYDRVSILLNRGVLHLDFGSLHLAAADFEECVVIATDAEDPLLVWKARHNLAYVDFLAGRIPRALAAMEEASRDLPAPDLHPVVLLDRARVLREAGLIRDADQLLEEAAAALEEAELHQDLGETNLVRAECALVEGEVEVARVLAESAEQLFGRRGNRQWQRKAQLMALRCERAALRDPVHEPERAFARLADRARALVDECRSEGRLDLAYPASLLALECELRAGDRTTTTALAPRMRAGDPLPARLQTREVRALSAAAAGDRSRAAAEVRRGLAELGSYQNSFGSLDLRTASAVHGLPLARLGLDLADRSGSAAEVFAAVERARAVSTRLASVGPPQDGRTADLLGALRQTQEQLRDLGGDPAAADELHRLRARAARLQSDIRARAWELEGGPAPETQPSARVSDVRRAARETGSSFVSYVVHRGRCRAVVASGRRPRSVDLGPAELVDELVRRVHADLDAVAMPSLPAPLADAVRRSLGSTLRRLDDLLVAPLRLPAGPLVVSCSASLALLPWTLLPSRRRLPVVVAPSATAWLRSGWGARHAQPRVVSVAGPGLHRAHQEAEAVRGAWDQAELLTGERATTAAVASALAEADLVHVAGHGLHQRESPLFSSLRLADGPLFAYELDARGESAPCVVLSACEAGLSTVRPGDEGLGLTSVLLHLGTRSVLAGVARVRDDVAASVMGRVHVAMAGGVDSAQALAAALAEAEDPAPFVAFGSTW